MRLNAVAATLIIVLYVLALIAWTVVGEYPSLSTPSGRLIIAIGILSLPLLLWILPKLATPLSTNRQLLSNKESFEIENSSRATLAQVLGGLILLAGLGFTWREVASTQESLQLSEQGQVTERFTRATEQLGSESSVIRLSGVYALAQIAGGYEEYRVPVMEILAAFVRENAPRSDSEPPQREPKSSYRNEIQAILYVISDLNRQAPMAPNIVDLRSTDLEGMDLSGAMLEGVILESTSLEKANLQGALLSSPTHRPDLRNADLDGANLDDVHLEGARLDGASISCIKPDSSRQECAVLVNAHLDGAILADANMRLVVFTNSYLGSADLDGTHLEGATLTSAQNLTQAQISLACTDEETKLPTSLVRNPNVQGC